MHSMYLFLLNVAGRAQDKFSISPIDLQAALAKNEVFKLEEKNTNVTHPVIIDSRVAPMIKSFVDVQVQAKSPSVWGVFPA